MNIKWLAIASASWLCAFVIWLGVYRTVHAASPTRFDKITVQKNDRHVNEVQYFEVWHDNESGQEFVCAFGESGDMQERAPSCFPSGRNWRNR